MQSYQTPETSSSEYFTTAEKTRLPALSDGGSPLLVIKSISQRRNESNNPVKSFLVYREATKLVRDYVGRKPASCSAARSEISSFSAKSKSRLKFVASNSFPVLISQFGMTYHRSTPDGRTVKKHLNQFLTELRFKYPDAKHLWILEFQSRGTAHFHIFLSLEHSKKLGQDLGTIWHRIAEPGSKEHLRFHRNEKNFIPWDMGSGVYLCKYLDKEHQKAVPPGFSGVGRFWGNSRGLVPEPDEILSLDLNNAFSHESINETTGEVTEFDAVKFIVRTLCHHHEKSLHGSPWKSSARKRPTCYTLPHGSKIMQTLETYLYKEESRRIPF